MYREIKVTGPFDKETLSILFKKLTLEVGDVLVSRKDERFTVTKIFPVERFLPDGSRFRDGMAFDMTGSKKGKVFTVYVR